MTLPFVRTVAILCLACAPELAWAQAETGTGGSPDSTVTAPNTTGVGQTKPPGSALGPEARDRGNRDEIEKRNQAIPNGICIGCNK